MPSVSAPKRYFASAFLSEPVFVKRPTTPVLDKPVVDASITILSPTLKVDLSSVPSVIVPIVLLAPSNDLVNVPRVFLVAPLSNEYVRTAWSPLVDKVIASSLVASICNFPASAIAVAPVTSVGARPLTDEYT